MATKKATKVVKIEGSIVLHSFSQQIRAVYPIKADMVTGILASLGYDVLPCSITYELPKGKKK